MSTSNDQSNKSFRGEGEDDEINDSQNKHVAGINQEKLEILKSMCLKVNWQIENERHEFLRILDCLIGDWQGQLPDLRDIFRKEEIDWLLLQSVSDMDGEDEIPPFIEFVARSGYKDEPDLDEDGKPILRRTTAVHEAFQGGEGIVVPILFKIYDRFDVNYIDKYGYTHFHIACRDGSTDVVEKFLELGQDPNCLVRKTDNSPLHLALQGDKKEITLLLLRYGADPTLADEDGTTPLHLICKSQGDDDDFVKMLLKIREEKHRQVQVDVKDKFGYTPLHDALANDNIKIAKLLLQRGADPNLGNHIGETALQILCFKENDVDIDTASLLFEMGDQFGKPIEVNAQSTDSGRAALHWAMEKGNVAVAELLLRRGANPNLADIGGDTPLHIFCMKKEDDDDDDDDGTAITDLMEILIEACCDEYRPVQIDAQNEEGNTPLHLAVRADKHIVIEWLLKNEANQNLANKKGHTPLHVLCMDNYYDLYGVVRIYFEICDEHNRPVLVDVKDNEGLTPLQWAVANFLFDAVDAILDHGADLSNFVFPNESYFGKELEMISRDNCFMTIVATKLRNATHLLPVINRLEKAGYELDRDDVLTVVKFFVKYEVFEKSRDLEEYNWFDDEEFLAKAKNIMVKPDLSFGDAMQLPPRQAEKLLALTRYDEDDTFEGFRELPDRQQTACVMHLCEKATRRLFQRWALDPFWKLIHYRLPIECCEMILDNLKNEDLCNILLAGAGQN